MRKRVTVILAVLALISVTAAGIGKAYAYFTSYVEVKGSRQLRIHGGTEIKEDFDDWVKNVVVTADEDSAFSYYVRAQVIYSPVFDQLSVSGDGWTYNEADEYWYYMKNGKYTVLDPGQSTTSLDVKIAGEEGQAPPSIGPNESADVVITYETVIAIAKDFDANGNPIYYEPDWNSAESGD